MVIRNQMHMRRVVIASHSEMLYYNIFAVKECGAGT